MRQKLYYAFLFLLILSNTWGASRTNAPVTLKKAVTDKYYDVTVVDNYRWLDHLDDPAVKKWNNEQNAYTRSILDKVSDRKKIEARLEELYTAKTVDYYGIKYRKGFFFALKSQPPKEQPFIVALKSVSDLKSERIIIDPNTLDSKGSTAIDFFVPSLDGKMVAVSLSQNGSEDGTVHVVDASTGKELNDRIPRVNYPTAAGSVVWNSDSSGFYYTRYPQGSERPVEDMNFYQQVYFHKLGTPVTQDSYAIGKDFPRIAEIALSSTDDGRYILATVANGDGGEFAHYLLDTSGKWTQITKFSDKVIRSAFGKNNHLYLLSRNGAPKGKILDLNLTTPALSKARLIIPETENVIEQMIPTMSKLYTTDLIGGPSQIRVFDLLGKEQGSVQIERVSSVGEALRTEGDELLFRSETYLEPAAWYRYDSSTGKTTRTALFRTSPANFNDAEVLREFASSKDGSRIPLNIIRLKTTKLNGQNPTILYAYGGFGISETPGFSVRERLWLDMGGVYVIANIRGGGEFGEEWHNAGKLTHKQNVFDDFAAAAQYLIHGRYTNSSRLAIEGGSNGGLLMGATLTQHPKLFRAVVSYVGIYDMLRVELFPNGAFNVTEYGTVKKPDQFKALYAYSPYHHVEDGTAYPAVLFLTGDHDGRVDPANSRKMTARLQAATGADGPILLRTTSKAGHGFGTALSERLAQQTDVFAFLVSQLGTTY